MGFSRLLCQESLQALEQFAGLARQLADGIEDDEAAPRILSAFAPQLSEHARGGLERLGVEVRTGAAVSQLGPGSVTLRAGGLEEVIRARTVLWAAGGTGSPLGQRLGEATGAELDGAGRVKVAPDCSVPGWPDLFVIGDLTSMADLSNKPLPGIAPVAMQQGRYVAGVLRDRLAGRPSCPFRYSDRGSMATVGRSYAIVDFGRLRIWGFAGWVTWLFVHLLFLVQFQSRVLVLIQWAWNYVTRNRAARLITGSR
ncbi:MAG: FAD-dependent oxidoreductase [Candidatus Wallbacteria bacterium]|nr:FAD-dependent oxidoreductase [Candidatus Wallbacteria bacterium]